LLKDLLNECRGLLDTLLPASCPVCEHDFAPACAGLCPSCLADITPLPAARCPICALPYPIASELGHLCGPCTVSRPLFGNVHAIGLYQGVLSKAVHALKYRRSPLLSRSLGAQLAEAVRQEWQPAGRALIAAVPLYPTRLRQRGFNQALLLARQVGRRLGWPVISDLLQKPVATPLQQELGARQRRANLRGAIVASRELAGESVLLVDDVMTTGTTSRVCSEVLLAAGAGEVRIAVIARAERTLFSCAGKSWQHL